MRLTWTLYENPYYDSASPMVADLARYKLTASQISNNAFGGFSDGQIAFEEPSERFIQNAIDNWLTKRAVATDGGGRIVWEGYVAEIEYTLNNQHFIRSIDNYANRIFIEYRAAGGACPKGTTCKGRVQLNEADVLPSGTQAKYGIKEEWLDYTGQGVMSSTVATAIGEVKLPQMLRARNYTFSLGEYDKKPNSLTLVLWGYFTTLQWRKQSIRFRTATDIGTIVSRALSYASFDKAPFISSDVSQIETFGVTRTWNAEGKPIWLQDYIAGAIAEGDIGGRYVLFQVWENRMAYCYSRSTAPRYFTRSDDPRVWDANRNLVPPYLVRAGGFMVSENQNETGNPLDDTMQRPRASFIDRAVYDDLTEKLSVPHSGDVITPERLLARARVVARKHS